MKKTLWVSIFLLLCALPSYAQTIIPSRPGDGIYLELSGGEVTGPIELTGTVSGSGLNEFIGAGKFISENYIQYSNDFGTGVTYWRLSDWGSTATDSGEGYFTIFQATGQANFINHAASTGPADEIIVSNIDVKPTTVDALKVTLVGLDAGGTDTLIYDNLPLDRWSTLRLTSTSTDTFYGIRLHNTDSVNNCSVDTKNWGMHRKVAPAIYFDGDSTMYTAVNATGLSSPSNTWAALYGLKHKVDYDMEAVSGNGILVIRDRVILNLDTNQKKYEMIVLSGGSNNIFLLDQTPTQMLAAADLMVDAAKIRHDKIYFLTIPLSTSFTVPMTIAAVAYNDGLIAAYANDTYVTVIDLGTMLVDADFPDGTHPDVDGHKKIYDYFVANVPIPYKSETYEHPVTAIPTIPDVNYDSSRSEARSYIDWTSTRTISGAYTVNGNVDDYAILIDASGATVTATLRALPEQGEKYIFNCLDDNAGANNCVIGRGGNNIGGVAADLTLSEGEVRVIQYDPTYGWFYCVQTI